MAKYPGSQIAYEYGTNLELAKLYNVSERTIYRWKARARSEEGLTLNISKYPGSKKLEKFKGTRKQLAAKYGISERTAYRWLNKARTEGSNIPSRGSSKYPGAAADLSGKLSDVAAHYGVSERTISRWKNKQEKEKKEQQQPFEDAITEAEDLIEEDYTQPEEVTEDYFEEDLSDFASTMSEDTFNNLQGIADILTESEDLLVEGSIFNNLTKLEKLQYLDAYIQYQYDLDEHQFYDESEHKMNFDPDFISTINIWGEEFENWAQKQFDYTMYEV